jgi:hypothetical protein
MPGGGEIVCGPSPDRTDSTPVTTVPSTEGVSGG